MANKGNLRIVLDTNVFLVSLVPSFKLHWVFEAIQLGKVDLIVSNEILMEYEEKIEEKFGVSLAESKLDFLLLLPNVELVNPYFNWGLIHHDPDDNKFVDSAISGNADYLVTNDKHFRVLKEIDFPSVNVVTAEEFEQILSK